MKFLTTRVYLDSAAATPPSTRATRAFVRALAMYGNPSSPHTEGRVAKALLEDARTRIARLAGTKAGAVVFTSGATEANALAIEGYLRTLTAGGRNLETMHLLYLAGAHASTVGTIEALGRQGALIESLECPAGTIDLQKLRACLRPTTVLVVLDLVCGETGSRFKTRDVRRVLDVYQKETGIKIRLHVDASQAPLIESFELSHVGADTLALDAQKVGGVRGIGVLLAPKQAPLTPLMVGGGQEGGLRPGTESPALACACAVALEDAASGRDAFYAHAYGLRELLLKQLAACTPYVLNEGKEQAPHILNISLLGRDTDYLVALLDEAGFAVSTKSACETDSPGSRAVLAYTGDRQRAAATLRISFGPTTTTFSVERFARALVAAVRFLDEAAI